MALRRKAWEALPLPVLVPAGRPWPPPCAYHLPPNTTAGFLRSVAARAPAQPAPLTVTDVVVGVADAEVAPAILHAVAPVGALRVHVAGRGRDFYRDRRKSRLRRSRGPLVLDKGWAAQDQCSPQGDRVQALLRPAPFRGGVGGHGTTVEDLYLGVPAQPTIQTLAGGCSGAGQESPSFPGPPRPWLPTEFAEEPKEARGALAEGGVGSQASATVVTLTVVLGGSCRGEREQPLMGVPEGGASPACALPLATSHTSCCVPPPTLTHSVPGVCMHTRLPSGMHTPQEAPARPHALSLQSRPMKPSGHSHT